MASALLCVGVLAANKLHTSCELDKDKLEAFVKCVSLTGQGYKLYVDEFGATTVRRADDQEFDLMGKDSKMRDCLEQYAPDVKVELEANAGDDGQDLRECKDVGAVTNWLAENGAKGMTFVEQRDTAGGNVTLLKERDSTNLFTVARDLTTACTHFLVTKKTTGHCHTHTKVTKCIYFGNEGDTSLYVTIYVHHKCSTKENGRSKVIMVPVGSDSDRIKRRTFSYQGGYLCRSPCAQVQHKRSLLEIVS